MKTYPLNSIELKEAIQKQFTLVNVITKHFQGNEFLSQGDLGLATLEHKPHTTKQVECVLSEYFHSEAAILVRGAGTGALRFALNAALPHAGTILVHDAPIYPTTLTSLKSMGIKIVKCDFDNFEKVEEGLRKNKIDAILIQLTRQRPQDAYDYEHLISQIRLLCNLPIITDDNYAVMKVSKIGIEAGSDMSTFSTFKLLGPVGIGVIVGKREYINAIAEMQYSGGSQVQGYEAMEVLRGLCYAPVALAIQAEVVDTIILRLHQLALPEIKDVFVANAQSKVVIIEFKQSIARRIIDLAQTNGAATYPVGAESKYELVPMFYQVSNTFLKDMPDCGSHMIRINPMRAGADCVLRILQACIEQIRKEDMSCF